MPGKVRRIYNGMDLRELHYQAPDPAGTAHFIRVSISGKEGIAVFD
jgi:hypothetical protein